MAGVFDATDGARHRPLPSAISEASKAVTRGRRDSRVATVTVRPFARLGILAIVLIPCGIGRQSMPAMPRAMPSFFDTLVTASFSRTDPLPGRTNPGTRVSSWSMRECPKTYEERIVPACSTRPHRRTGSSASVTEIPAQQFEPDSLSRTTGASSPVYGWSWPGFTTPDGTRDEGERTVSNRLGESSLVDLTHQVDVGRHRVPF